MKELLQLNKSYFHIIFTEKNEFNNYFSLFENTLDENIVLKHIDGNNCTTIDGLFNEFSKKIEFPDYFGSNWAAFDECLNDLDWLPAKAYLLLITDTDKIIKESDKDFKMLINILKCSVNEWTEGRNYNEDFPTPPTPFHIVFQCSNDKQSEVEARFEMGGIEKMNILNINK